MANGEEYVTECGEGQPKISGMAITALVLSLIPICGITQLVGLILGIVSLGRIKNSGGRLKGKGMAISAIVISAVLLVVLPIFSLAGMLLPSLARAREEGRSAVCRQKLSQIGQAIYAYEQNEGKLPSTGIPGDSAGSLGLLVPDYIDDAWVFRCPSLEISTSNRGGDLTEENCSYEYDNTLSPDDPPDKMLAWDKDVNHNGGRNVLFHDGRVSWVSEEQFRSMRDKQRAEDESLPQTSP